MNSETSAIWTELLGGYSSNSVAEGFVVSSLNVLMARVVIIGAGGHAREVAEIVRDQAQRGSGHPLLGFIVDKEHMSGVADLTEPVLGDWSWFETVDRNELGIICAVGNPVTRKQLVTKARSFNLSFTNAISPAAHVFRDAVIGNGVMIFPHAVISRNVRLGNHTIVNAAATLGHDTELAEYATVSPGVHLAGNVSVGEGCYLGIGCSVIQRIRVGAWTTVGAGAVVVRDLPANVTAAGVPANIIKRNDLHEDSTCPAGQSANFQ